MSTRPFGLSLHVFSTCPSSTRSNPSEYLEQAVDVARWSRLAGLFAVVVWWRAGGIRAVVVHRARRDATEQRADRQPHGAQCQRLLLHQAVVPAACALGLMSCAQCRLRRGAAHRMRRRRYPLRALRHLVPHPARGCIGWLQRTLAIGHHQPCQANADERERNRIAPHRLTEVLEVLPSAAAPEVAIGLIDQLAGCQALFERT